MASDGRGRSRQHHRLHRPGQPDQGGDVDYIAQDNPTRAETFGQELRDKTLPLAQHPKMGRTGRPGLPAFVRELVAHRNYIVFYRVLDDAGTVEILRVKHAAQQMP